MMVLVMMAVMMSHKLGMVVWRLLNGTLAEWHMCVHVCAFVCMCVFVCLCLCVCARTCGMFVCVISPTHEHSKLPFGILLVVCWLEVAE